MNIQLERIILFSLLISASIQGARSSVERDPRVTLGANPPGFNACFKDMVERNRPIGFSLHNSNINSSIHSFHGFFQNQVDSKKVSTESHKSTVQKGYDPCNNLLGYLLQAEYHRLNDRHEQALEMLEKIQQLNPDCVEKDVLVAEILLELLPKNPSYEKKLYLHLNQSMAKFPMRFEFPLMALELSLYSNGESDLALGSSDYLEILEKILLKKTSVPRWVQADFLEFKAELSKQKGQVLSAARFFGQAWELNRENTLLLAESGQMFARFGMLRTSLRMLEQCLQTKEARTGYKDRQITSSILHKKLILYGTEESVIQFAQDVKNDASILEAAEQLLQVSRYETCRNLLGHVSKTGKNSIHFKAIAMDLAKKSHDYEKASALALELMEYANRTSAPLTPQWNSAMETFLETCILNTRPEKELVWFSRQNIKTSDVKGFSRVLLALIVFRENKELALWNHIFYVENPPQALTDFGKEAEQLGLEMTLDRIRLRRYTQLKDHDKVLELSTTLLGSATITVPVKIEVADSLAICGLTDQAFPLYRQLLELGPDNPLILNNYGYFLLLSGTNLAQAESFITRAANIDQKNPAYLDSLAWLAFHRREYQKARDILESIIDMDQPDPVKLEHLGDIYAALGEKENALDSWSQALQFQPQNFFDLLNKLDPE